MDIRNANGSTPLIIHSAAGNRELVRELIAQRANVDLQDDEGWSALMVASQNGNLEIVQALIFAAAIPDLKNKEVCCKFIVITPQHKANQFHLL